LSLGYVSGSSDERLESGTEFVVGDGGRYRCFRDKFLYGGDLAIGRAGRIA
jgi:hypothetical protein